MNFFYSILGSTPTFVQILLAVLITVVLAGVSAYLYKFFRTRDGYFKDMPFSLFLFPVILAVTVIIIDAVGLALSEGGSSELSRYARVAVAILSALLILRIRSQQRDVEDIIMIFYATVLGLTCGMGFVFAALTLFGAVMGVYVVLKLLHFPRMPKERMALKITVPENLDFEHAFDDILKKYTQSYFLKKVKTTDLGSLILLSYEIYLKKGVNSKELLDEIRARNGNLDVAVTYARYLSPNDN